MQHHNFDLGSICRHRPDSRGRGVMVLPYSTTNSQISMANDSTSPRNSIYAYKKAIVGRWGLESSDLGAVAVVLSPVLSPQGLQI